LLMDSASNAIIPRWRWTETDEHFVLPSPSVSPRLFSIAWRPCPRLRCSLAACVSYTIPPLSRWFGLLLLMFYLIPMASDCPPRDAVETVDLPPYAIFKFFPSSMALNSQRDLQTCEFFLRIILFPRVRVVLNGPAGRTLLFSLLTSTPDDDFLEFTN